MGMVTVNIPIDGDLPDVVGTQWCADTFGITVTSVNIAIHDGRLPAKRAGRTFVIDPNDAVRVWGHKLLRKASKNQTQK
jgi:hypothetical protein